MPVHEAAFAPGAPCWSDLMVDDVERAKSFYADLFGWTYEVGGLESGGYVTALKNGEVVAGLSAKGADQAEQPPAWTTYLATEDADASAEGARRAGGVFFVEPMDVNEMGRMALGADAAGAAFGLWESRAHTGANLVNEPGAMCWNELMSRDYEASKAFYTDVFDYRLEEIGQGGFQYSVASLADGRPIGGVGAIPAEAPADVPSHWMVYFGVDDCDAAAERVEALGGTVMQPPWDTPYGRMALVAGPQGETFSIMKMAPAPDGSHDAAGGA